jgi:hypothetical protein
MKNSKVCIDAYLACMIECEKCAISCLNMAGHQECVKLCRDCADICDLCAKLFARGSQFTDVLCAICVQCCEACATECEKYADHAACCKACAEACRKCVETCKM